MIIINSILIILIILLIFELASSSSKQHLNNKYEYRRNLKAFQTESVQNTYVDISKNKKGVLNFLFLTENGELYNEDIWNEFFSYGQNISFNVFTHSRNNANIIDKKSSNLVDYLKTKPSIIGKTNRKQFIVNSIVNPVASIPCIDDVGAMNQLLSVAINYITKKIYIDSQFDYSNSEYDSFIFLDSRMISVKPIHEVHNHFCRPNQDGRSKSLFCLNPTLEWIKSEKTQDTLIKHHQWIILSRDDVLRSIELYDNYQELIYSNIHNDKASSSYSSTITNNMLYNLVHFPISLTWRKELEILQIKSTKKLYDVQSIINAMALIETNKQSKCLGNYWFFNSLYPVGDKLINDFLPLVQSDIEQGFCHSYVYNTETLSHSLFRKKIVIFEKNITLKDYVYGPLLIETDISFLFDLYENENFYFAGFFDKNTLVRGYHNTKHTLLEAMKLLHIFKANTVFDDANDGKIGSKSWRRSGDKNGLKVLMISTDTREVKLDLGANDYVSMASVLTHEYALFHGYDYLRVMPNTTLNTHFGSDEFYEKYGIKWELGYNEKYGVTCFHPRLKHFRASSWAKMPLIWHANNLWGKYYDYIFYIDSDATISPVYGTRSLSDAFKDWELDKKNSVMWGNKSPKDSSLIFFSNLPWREDYPCAGMFILKTQTADVVLREWWNYDLATKRWEDFMEQDAMWYILENSNEFDFFLNKKTVSIMMEPQMPSNWFGIDDLWTLHLPNYESQKNRYFLYMLGYVDRNHDLSFSQAAYKIKSDHELVVDILDIADKMVLADNNIVRDKYPTEWAKGRQDDLWHAVGCNLGYWRPKLPAKSTTMHDGMLFKLKSGAAIYMVLNGTKRAFPNWDTFVEMGIDMSEVQIYNDDVDKSHDITSGPDLPAVGTAEFNPHIMSLIKGHVKKYKIKYPNLHDKLLETIDHLKAKCQTKTLPLDGF